MIWKKITQHKPKGNVSGEARDVWQSPMHPKGKGTHLAWFLHDVRWVLGVGWGAERTKIAWISHFSCRTNKSNTFHLLGKLPSNKKAVGSLAGRKRSKVGALINPNWLSHHHEPSHLWITSVVSSFPINVEASRIGITFYSFFVSPVPGTEQVFNICTIRMD